MQCSEQEAAAQQAARLDAVTHSSVLALIFERLPPVEQCVAVSRLGREWRRWAPRAEQLRREHAAAALGARRLPLWFVQEAWPAQPSPAARQRVVARAAWHGDVAALAWARHQQQGVGAEDCSWPAAVCRAAAEGGSLAALQWLRRQEPPCPWDDSVCRSAAEGGHLHVLQWLRGQEPPCPWSDGACSKAARRGHLAVLQWQRGQDPPCPCGFAALLAALNAALEEEAAAQQAARIDAVAHPAVLALIFERLPPVEQCVAESRLGPEWRRWAAPKARALRRIR
ncbi:MAG: hypothetical protein J3K34DRAFT_521449 [Monoraphidium minutum]|nr:MAG: hypothetical protein J3K34DRAFT_521449 [Monoraphidium minutum]